MARKQKEERDESSDTAVDETRAEPRVYELGFHIDPELSQEDVKKIFQKLKAVAAEAGTVVATGDPEKMPLAYTISRMEHTGRHDFSTTFFSWIAYEATGEAHDKVLETVRGEDHVFRFIDILTTKDAALHAAEQREMRMRVADTSSGPEEAVSEEQLDAALEEVAA
ncbi:MAG: hypothetical protein B7X04_00245 [Parcubacteria group bacterium 21-54-25]|nr:MAG: hypothetical protein B7X04_00245 [Parcubacteria group bacterium 21-54-25]HQU07512.1 30S ribosomal protein S6 [Candidatus Paceibacterota bacterium]